MEITFDNNIYSEKIINIGIKAFENFHIKRNNNCLKFDNKKTAMEFCNYLIGVIKNAI